MSLDEAGPPDPLGWPIGVRVRAGLRGCVQSRRVCTGFAFTYRVRTCPYVCVYICMYILTCPSARTRRMKDSSLDSKIASVDGDCAALAPSASASPLRWGCTDMGKYDGEVRQPCIRATGQ